MRFHCVMNKHEETHGHSKHIFFTLRAIRVLGSSMRQSLRPAHRSVVSSALGGNDKFNDLLLPVPQQGG